MSTKTNMNADVAAPVTTDRTPVQRPGELRVRILAFALAIGFATAAAATPDSAVGFGERLALGYGAMVSLMAALRVAVTIPGLIGAFGCGALMWKNPPGTSYATSVPLAVTAMASFCLAVWSQFGPGGARSRRA